MSKKNKLWRPALAVIAFLISSGAVAGLALPEGLEKTHRTIPVICGDSRILYQELTEVHGEVPARIAFTTDEVLVVWFTNSEQTTMSLVIDSPTGSCLIYSARCYGGDCFITPGKVEKMAGLG